MTEDYWALLTDEMLDKIVIRLRAARRINSNGEDLGPLYTSVECDKATKEVSVIKDNKLIRVCYAEPAGV